MNQRRSHLDIRKMSCANRSATITERLESLGGHRHLRDGRGAVEYDPERVSLDAVSDAIEDAGYEPGAESVTITRHDPGLLCANGR